MGLLRAGQLTLSCTLGQAGVQHAKKEGDKATPAGRFALLYGFFRADRATRPASLLPVRPLCPADGWCDDPKSPLYNRPVPLPFRASHEKLWRGDSLYDLVIVLDYNLNRRCKKRGSAIFLHCASENFAPTEGCVALSAKDLRKLLPRLSRRPVLIVR
ncbi:MAG TPA: L,D-transpeptidase family protein [Methylocella sp.]|nr:L,D-transpeptidase family protein [Methylocella sp.]